jgi:HEAT repeat protein
MSTKRFCAAFVTALVLVSSAAGQTSREMSVEESYLQESIELMIIRETSRADSRDQKLVALSYIGEAIDRGSKGEDIRQALEYLSLEGVLNQARENGRLVNNFPDVRRQAAKYLGELGTIEAKDTLIKICLAENEPMVLQEAVKSIGDINVNDNIDDTIAIITWIVSRFDILNPDNMLALAAIETFEKIAEQNNGIKDPNAVRLLIRISEGAYIKPVQDRARQSLTNLRKYGVRQNQSPK